jgi:hypothetical protein
VDLNYHRIDAHKKEFGLNDRVKPPAFEEKYDLTMCLYSYTSRLFNHWSQHRLPYVLLYNVLSKGSDLTGGALVEWKAQVEAANLSLVADDITNTVLRSQALHCYQMRSLAQYIVDITVFRVLIFNQLKNKTVVKQDLLKLRMESTIKAVTYDGIQKMSQHAIRMFRLFIKEETAVSELVNIISSGIHNSGVDYAQKAADFKVELTKRITTYITDQASSLEVLSRKDQNLRIFAVIEIYCRELQQSIRQAFNTHGPRLAMTSTVAASFPSNTTSNTTSSMPFRPRPSNMSSSSPAVYKRHNGNVNSTSTQVRHSDDETLNLFVPPDVNQLVVPQDSEISWDFKHSHTIPINQRVDATMNKLHIYGQARTLRRLYDNVSDELPEGAIAMQSAELQEPTIHVTVANVYDIQGSVIDTKFTIDDKP